MKKYFRILLTSLIVIGLAACDNKQPVTGPDEPNNNTETPGNGDNNENNGDNGNTGELPKFEFPFSEEYPIECGNLIAEGSEVGVTI